MDQDEIYNLLLLVLLMSNSRDGNDTGLSTQGSVNELILASMLLNSLNGRSSGDDDDDSDNRRCSCSRRNQNNGNTTF